MEDRVYLGLDKVQFAALAIAWYKNITGKGERRRALDAAMYEAWDEAFPGFPISNISSEVNLKRKNNKNRSPNERSVHTGDLEDILKKKGLI